MVTTKLSSKGQVIIPKPIRRAHGWEIGQELIVTDVGDGIFIKPKSPFATTLINDVAGCLIYDGLPKTLAEMEEAIRKGIEVGNGHGSD